MSRVLVTGTSGFIGRHALAPLKDAGFDIHTVGRQPDGPEALRATHHQADLLDIAQVKRVIRDVGADHLLHFAWFVKPGEVLQSVNNFRWVLASLEMLRVFRENGGSRAVMAGTCFEYDLHRAFLSEVTPCEPSSVYGICKNALRQISLSYAELTGLSTAWGRIFFLYGPHEYPSRLVASIMNAVLRNKAAKCSHGRQIRDFLHVQDVANAFVALLASEVTGVVNIASGQPISIGELAYKIAGLVGREDLVELGALPSPKDTAPVILGDTRRLHNEVGWEPSILLDDGLARTLAWWKEQLDNKSR